MTTLMMMFLSYVAGVVTHAALIAWWDRVKGTQGMQDLHSKLDEIKSKLP